MNISFYIRKVTFGGGERMKLTLMTEFIKQGHEILIFSHNNEELNKLSFPFKRIILDKKKNSIIQAVSDGFAINKSLQNRDIHCLFTFGFSIRFIVASYFRKTTSIVYPTVDPKFYKNKIKLWIRSMLCFSLCDGIIFQTEIIQKRYSNRTQLKSVVIPNPIMDDFLPIPLKERKQRVVSIGRLSEEKNYPLLINAFSNISPNDYTLHIYGDGPLKSYLQELIAKLRMEDKIFLEGQVNRVVDKISDAEIFVLCSNFEGMPNALIEAMAMGLACISTNFPSGAAEFLIKNKRNGLLISVGDQKQLEESLELLIKDKALTNRIGESAIEVRDLLKKENIIGEWLSFVKKTVNQSHNK